MTNTRCLMCGAPADGRLRVALWQEEEKGRLSAKSAPLCPSCHARFLSGDLTRVEVARKFHEDRGYRPAEWIDRIDRDALLDISCLGCGILLPVGETSVDRVVCPRCAVANLFAERKSPGGKVHLTASVEATLGS